MAMTIENTPLNVMMFGYMMADHAMDAIDNGEEITGTSIFT